MKILQLFGLGDTSTLLTVALRRAGVDCDILLSNRAFVTQYPAWTKKYPELKEGCYHWDASDMLNPSPLAHLYKFFKHYDYIIAHPPAGAYMWNQRTPYAIWDGGSGNFIMSKTHDTKQFSGKINREMARRSYKHADHIFFNDINVIYSAWEKVSWSHNRYSYIPLPIDTQVFKPVDAEPFPTFTAYMPTRQEVYIKGIEEILRGFKQFTTYAPEAHLMITRYGSDVPVTDYLIEELNLQKNIQWVPLIPKQQFAQLVCKCHVIIDQIKLGAIGGVSAQAMACERPVIVNANTNWYTTHLGASPPVLNAKNTQQVTDALLCAYHNPLTALRRHARTYIQKHFEYNHVAQQLLKEIHYQ